MRHALLAVVAAALAVGAALPAQAQGTFPLKYREAGEPDSLVWIYIYHGGSGSPPEGLKAPPKGLSEKALYFSMPVGGKSVLVIIDKTSPPRLFVDAAGTGDLSGAKPIVSRSKGSEPVFSPVTVAPAGTGGPSGQVRFIYCKERSLGMVQSGSVWRDSVESGGRPRGLAGRCGGVQLRWNRWKPSSSSQCA